MNLSRLVRIAVRALRNHGLSCESKTKIPPIFARYYCRSDEKQDRSIVVHGSFEDVDNKTRDTYLDMIYIFINRDEKYRRGHVEFVYAALKNMEAFGVHKDLEVYKSLINVLPKGKFISTNVIQVEFMHYPKQQQCIIDLLEQMEDNGVMPDYEMEDMLSNIFGNRAYPLRKYWRMMYWMPKFKNASPWPAPESSVLDNTFELAKYAIHRITSVDAQIEIQIYQTKEVKDSVDDTWVVSAQSPTQKYLLQNHDVNEPIYVLGASRVWVKNCPVNYFMLKAKAKPKKTQKATDFDDVSDIKVSYFNLQPPIKKYLEKAPSVHEQDDGTILAVCATGTSSKDSLLSWIRHLEKDGNPLLADVSIVFTLRTGPREIAVRSS